MMRIALALLLFTPLVAHAQAPTSFAQGVLAFEKKEWANAERLMRESVAGNPNETHGTVRISGSWFETYVPHYFLGRALAKQGKCAEALVAFAESERQGVTPAISDFARHLETRGGCAPQRKPAKPGRQIGEVEVPFGEDVPTPTPPTPQPQPTPLSQSQPNKPLTPADDSAARARAKEQAIRETRTRLSAAVAAYLRGDYTETTRLLATPFADRAAAAEAALFRAAAGDALYRIGGSKNDALRKQVEADLRTYRALRPNGRPDPRVFPPRFVAMAGKR